MTTTAANLWHRVQNVNGSITTADGAVDSNPSLAELIAKFQSVQKIEEGDGESDTQTRKVKLNDRNAVDIINVLTRRGLRDVMLTSDGCGQGYITREQVRRDVRNEVIAAGGRVNTVDLPTLVRVDMVQIERAVRELLAEQNAEVEAERYRMVKLMGADENTCSSHQPSNARLDCFPFHFIEVNGELISNAYLWSLEKEASNWLKERGHFNISDFAKRCQLPISFVIESIIKVAVRERRLGEEAVVSQCGTIVYTGRFVAAQRSKLTCALLGTSTLVNLSDLFARHNIFPLLAMPLLNSTLANAKNTCVTSAAGTATNTIAAGAGKEFPSPPESSCASPSTISSSPPPPPPRLLLPPLERLRDCFTSPLILKRSVVPASTAL